MTSAHARLHQAKSAKKKMVAAGL
ncbi:hypothetical protein A2U01_0080607, partial [Trifolium medium]|nr:hypothetical protein [Trifolium medium]